MDDPLMPHAAGNKKDTKNEAEHSHPEQGNMKARHRQHMHDAAALIIETRLFVKSRPVPHQHGSQHPCRFRMHHRRKIL